MSLKGIEIRVFWRRKKTEKIKRRGKIGDEDIFIYLFFVLGGREIGEGQEKRSEDRKYSRKTIEETQRQKELEKTQRD